MSEKADSKGQPSKHGAGTPSTESRRQQPSTKPDDTQSSSTLEASQHGSDSKSSAAMRQQGGDSALGGEVEREDVSHG